ncbi:hypothetical protein, partial [Staphylococcus haemolyticus]|uniref:hypothetical protein n=1 Tax=Staphylococcus haemolyticus TaxID=1283 RepID=UPI001642A6AC
PSCIVEMNNEISGLGNEEGVEGESMVRELRGMVGGEADGWVIGECVMGEIDFLTGKGRYAG